MNRFNRIRNLNQFILNNRNIHLPSKAINTLDDILGNTNKIKNDITDVYSIIKMDPVVHNNAWIRKEFLKINRSLNTSTNNITQYLLELETDRNSNKKSPAMNMKGHVDRF